MALLIACGGGQSAEPANSGDVAPKKAAPVKKADAESPLTAAEKTTVDQAEGLSTAACACTSKVCADQHVGKLFAFVIAQRARKAGKRARRLIADHVAKQIRCAEAQSVNRAVMGRLLLIAATTAKDWAQEVQKLRDASCDCKKASCSETVLHAFAALVAKLKTVRVTKDEAVRAGQAGQVMTNCMKSLGLTQAQIQATLTGGK